MHGDTRTYNQAQSPADRAICRLLAREIDRALPEAENKIWHAHPVWFLDGNPIVGYSKLKHCVRLLFWSGQSFKTRGLTKEGTFKAAEARYTAADQVDVERLASWLAESREVQWDYRNLMRRKGRLVRLKGRTATAKPKMNKSSTKTAGEVVLLSGGNPQIAKADGNAPVQAYIAAMPGWKREVGLRLDGLIEQTVPGVRKAVKWNSPLYGIEGKGWFLGVHTFTKYVKVAFFRGVDLRPVPPDPSKDEYTRYINIREGQFDETQMAAWIAQAATLPGWIP